MAVEHTFDSEDKHRVVKDLIFFSPAGGVLDPIVFDNAPQLGLK